MVERERDFILGQKNLRGAASKICNGYRICPKREQGNGDERWSRSERKDSGIQRKLPSSVQESASPSEGEE